MIEGFQKDSAFVSGLSWDFSATRLDASDIETGDFIDNLDDYAGAETSDTRLLGTSWRLPPKQPNEKSLSAGLIEEIGDYLSIPIVACSSLKVDRASDPLAGEPGHEAWRWDLEARLFVDNRAFLDGAGGIVAHGDQVGGGSHGFGDYIANEHPIIHPEKRHAVCCPSASQARWLVKARHRFGSNLRLDIVLITTETRALVGNVMAIAHLTPPQNHRLLSDIEVRRAAKLMGLDYMEVDQLPLPVEALLRRQPMDPDQWGHLSRVKLNGRSVAMLAPSSNTLVSTARQLTVNPALRHCLKLTSMAALREATRRPYRARCVALASEGLLRGPADLSAKTVTVGDRPMLALIGSLTPVIAALFLPVLLHLVICLVILCVSFLRAGAWWEQNRLKTVVRARQAPRLPTGALPRYTVLVPLYDEDAVVARLTAALQSIDYPLDRLQILMIVEESDARTNAALQGQSLPRHFEILTVPPYGPKNKPKALNYAVQHASGEFITIYDAEDRPEPDQLRKAAAQFLLEGRNLACLQAQLAIDHGCENWLTAQFALEYDTLFRGILPFLSRLGWAFPLGGTSNHFRKGVLVSLGAWDAFNVTEDADLSFRLAKQSWVMKVLDSTTFEEAPVSLNVWMAQRRRWFKGWVQTLVVHLARPRALMTDLSPGDAFSLLTMVGGGLILLAIHPFFIVLILWQLVSGAPWVNVDQFWSIGFFAAEISVLLGGYAIAMGSASLAATRLVGPSAWKLLITIPVYWVLLSAAFYGALLELARDPGKWNKTPHGRAKRRPRR